MPTVSVGDEKYPTERERPNSSATVTVGSDWAPGVSGESRVY